MFGVLIFIHELGHFIAAKAFKVGITEFSIGMGPKLISRKGRDGVAYSLRLIPMGGFVSMVGEDEEVSDDEQKNALYRKPAWQRFIVFAAGAFMNLAFGLILMGVLVGSSDVIYSTEISGFGAVNDAGEKYMLEEWKGLRSGDVIEKIGNRKINIREDFVYEVMFVGDAPCDVTVKRDGKSGIVVKDVVFPSYTEDGITFGNAAFIWTAEAEKTVPEIIKQTFCRTASSVKMIWSSLLNTIKGKYGTQSLSGPVGVVEQVEETVSYGWDSFMFLVIIITINLGIMNLLPLPALDGGRLLFLIIEMVRRKPINPKYEGFVHAAGLVLLIGLMIFVTYNDIARIFFK